MASSPDDRVAHLVDEVRRGDRRRLGELVELVYPELHRVAAAYMRRERPGGTIQATGLVHEAYLRLVQDRQVAPENRAHFCAIAANVMRRILVERARGRHAAKRGGGAPRVTLVEGVAAAPADASADVEVLALHGALEKLAAIDSDRARLVELRYFGGLTIEEAAQAMGTSPASVKRSWALARAWLQRELERGGEGP